MRDIEADTSARSSIHDHCLILYVARIFSQGAFRSVSLVRNNEKIDTCPAFSHYPFYRKRGTYLKERVWTVNSMSHFQTLSCLR